MHKELTFSHKLVDTYLSGCKKYNGLHDIFEISDLDIDRLRNGDSFTASELSRLSKNAVVTLDDINFQMFDSQISASAMDIVARTASTAQSMKELLFLSEELHKAFNNPYQPKILIDGDNLVMEFNLVQSSTEDPIIIQHHIVIRALMQSLYVNSMADNQLHCKIFLACPFDADIYKLCQSFGIPAISWGCKKTLLYFPNFVDYRINPNARSTTTEFIRDNRFDIFDPSCYLQNRAPLITELKAWLYSFITNENRLPGIEKASEHLNCHPKTLTRKLAKNATSFLELKNEVIHTEARRLLKFTDMSLEDIADQLGFSDSATFARAFKNYNQMTPRGFRNFSEL